MSGYGQFCPVAKAMELLDERWTLLVVRELLLGSRHFNDLRRGVPKMSPALLSKRLKSLTRAGVVQRDEIDGRTTYSLTQCGQELATVVDALGSWGVRWIGELGEQDLDPHLLMWDIRRTIPIDAWPRSRTTLAFQLDGVAPKASRWWLVVAEGEADVCDFDPGYEPAGTVANQPAHADPHLARGRGLVARTARRQRRGVRPRRCSPRHPVLDRSGVAGRRAAPGVKVVLSVQDAPRDVGGHQVE